MSTNKQKTGFYVETNVIQDVDSLLEEAHVNSRSEFMQKALKFYISFLKTNHVEQFLLPTFTAALSGEVGGTEERISRMLYKLAVEVAMMDRVLAYDKNIPESVLLQIREVSEMDVKENTGYWEKDVWRN